MTTDSPSHGRLGTQLPPAITEVSHNFEAGRLQYFVHEWQKLTNDPHILDIVAPCHLDINDDISHLFFEDIEYVFSEEEKSITTQEIGKFLDFKVIKQTQTGRANCFPNFSVEEKGCRF